MRGMGVMSSMIGLLTSTTSAACTASPLWLNSGLNCTLEYSETFHFKSNPDVNISEETELWAGTLDCVVSLCFPKM